MNKKILRWNFVFQYGYVITNIINSFILLPFYLKNIEGGTLGLWLATTSILGWMTLADPGVGDVLQQKIADLKGKNEYDEVGKTIGSGFIASGFILLFSLIAGFIFYMLINTIINNDISKFKDLPTALIISVVATGFSLVSFSLSGINQGMQNSAHVAICALLSNFLFLVVNIVLLFLGFGVVSIALSNLARSLFINIYNFVALKNILRKERIFVSYELAHFKKFIKIFSFTSASRIIGGFAASLDMVVLARFVSPSLITIFEVNKKPIQQTGSLVGRHAVALMPSISHANGKGDQKAIIDLINTQFKYYSYAALFFTLIFCLNYDYLISAWTEKANYAGNTIIFLMLANFFFGLIGGFMANVGYALGDIKMNSFVNIFKGIIIGTLLFVVAPGYGITGILIVMLAGTILIDFTFFTYRLYKLGYLQTSLIKNIFGLWIIIVPIVLIIGLAGEFAVNSLLESGMYLVKLILNAGTFTVFFIIIVLMVDASLRLDVLNTIATVTKMPFLRNKILNNKN